MKRTVHIVLPIYNEAPSILQLLESIRDTMEKSGSPYRIIAVDDGSKDATAEILRDAAGTLPLTVITHKVNRGLWETIRDGFEKASDMASPDDVIVRLDGDNTHHPKYILPMIEKLNDGWEVVIASRFQKGGMATGVNAYRTFISYGANILMKIFFYIPGVWDYSCGYRAYRAGLIQDALRIFGNYFIDLKGVGFTCTIEKLIKMRMMRARIVEIPFHLRYDQKMSKSKMLSSMTTFGYLVLILKYIYPWGKITKDWMRQIKDSRRETIRCAE